MRAKIRFAFRWLTIAALGILAILAAAFWTMVLGGFAGSGFRAGKAAGESGQDVVITAECAWPYKVGEPEARSTCRMFYNLSPEQRAAVLKARR